MKKLWALMTLGITAFVTTLIILSGHSARAEVHAAPKVRSPHAPAATLVVTSTADSGYGTLRWAMQTAVASDTITFDPTVFPPANPVSITLTSGLPAIITDGVTIDGSSAGVILNGSGTSDGTPGLVIDGTNHVVIKGLQILFFPGDGIRLQGGATNSTIGGTNPSGSCTGGCNLISGNSGNGVSIDGSGAMGNTISGNYIGTNISGAAAISNTGDGVAIGDGAQYNSIADNLISGNGWMGLSIAGTETMSNTVSGNLIGLDVNGITDLGNAKHGILIQSGAQGNVIGGATLEERNIISANHDGSGIRIEHVDTIGNIVIGNFIGTDVNGTAALGNAHGGVSIDWGAKQNRIGGATAAERNLISGNNGNGVAIVGSGTMSNTVSGNYIGTTLSGTAVISNANDGISINDGASFNRIGGSNATPGGMCSGECNLVSGHKLHSAQVRVFGIGTDHNIVSGNYIGTDASGSQALGGGYGVRVEGSAQYNVVGGITSGERNLVSGNGQPGVIVNDSGTMSNTVVGNWIGTDASGTLALSNDGGGVSIGLGASYNLIGGSNATPGGACTGACNLISGNGSGPGNVGVSIRDSGTMSNTASGNYIGTDVYGTSALANGMDGVAISNGASRNTVGGHTAGERNLISGNGRDGADIGGAHDNSIIGNYIGTDASGTAALGNVERGVGINDGGDGSPSTHNVVEDNLISGNGSNGIDVWGPATEHTTVKGNLIGTDATGIVDLGNGNTGVWIGGGARYNTIGGSTPPDRNIISGNDWHGIRIGDAGTMSNTVSGNYIGTDGSGLADLGNGGVGVFIHWATQWNIIGGIWEGERNTISGNGLYGVIIAGESTGNMLIGNYIGTDAYGDGALGNGYSGVYIIDASANRIGGPSIGEGNIIAYNQDGIYLYGTTTLSNTISHNSIYHNTDVGIELVSGANAYIFPPLLTKISDTTVKGIAVPNATVEVFSDDDDEGRWFHGSTAADANGVFTFTVTAPFTGTNVTATATDPDGNTSEFSSPYAPSRDIVVAAIYAPQSRQQINQPFTPLVRVGNGGTAPETFTVTAVISRGSDGGLVYSDTQTVTDLGALHYRTLSFDDWTPRELGNYTFAAGLHLDTPDDDPGNDRLTQDFGVVDDRVDLWSRDNPADDGQEPAVGSVWQSPDIWVRNTADGLTDHQNPINNITNTVYVRMRNRGTLTATNAIVTAYWHPPALVIGQSWWESIGTVTADELAPGGVYTASMPWQPQITGVLTEPYHTCLIDVISSTQDVAPTFWDVRGSNNIEQRNVDIVAAPETVLLRARSSSAVSTTFSVGNPYAGEQLVDVLLDTTGLPAGTEVRLDLGGLFERWQRFGQGSLTGAEVISGTTQVALSGEQAVISGLPLMGEELFEVTLEVSGLRGRRGQVDASERIGGEVLGGVNLQVVGHFELYLPIVMRQ